MKIIYLKIATIVNLAWLALGKRNKNDKKNNWYAAKANSFDVNTIFSYFENHKPYLNKDLNLDLAAYQMGMHKQQLSYILNSKLEIHFPDLLSTYRVKEAQQKLLDPIFHNYTIDAIAQEAGFNSRANFYEAFKKHTGLTPTQYRKQFVRRAFEVTKNEWEDAMV